MFRRVAIALAITLAAGAALAQEYGRASGGELSLMAKQPSQFSGSLGVSRSSLFGSKGFQGALGGTVVADRLWFFGSVERNDALHFTQQLTPIAAVPTTATFGKIDAHLGDRQSLTGIVTTGTQFSAQTLSATPAWFGTMHYTGIISPNAFFSATVSQTVTH